MKILCKATCAVAITLAVSVADAQQRGQTLDELERNAPLVFVDTVDAYIYGFPLLMFGVTGRTATTVATAGDRLGAAPLNQFGKEPMLPDSSFTAVVLPSTSTLYASSFLNLQAGPVILHIPDMGGRFFLMQMLDGWTNVSTESPGSRLSSPPGDYALVGPDYKGPRPEGMQKIIQMPTNTMWIIGRIHTNGTDRDIEDIKRNVYPGLTLTPLKQIGSYVAPENLPLEPMVDFTTPPLAQVAGMDACAFFSNLASMMTYTPPITGQDEKLVRRLKRLGIVAGSPFDCRAMSVQDLPAMQLGVAAARAFLQQAPPPSGTVTHWTLTLGVGTYDNNYLLRAEVAEHALGANNPTDAVYAVGTNDGSGTPLDGSKNYKIHFAATGTERVPPFDGNGFWSLTIYDSAGKLVPYSGGMTYNAIGDPFVQKHHACFNNDGSIDLFLQPNPPSGGVALCNWLQTPSGGGYQAFLRIYWPDADVLNSKWIPPPIMPN